MGNNILIEPKVLEEHFFPPSWKLILINVYRSNTLTETWILRIIIITLDAVHSGTVAPWSSPPAQKMLIQRAYG